MKKRLLGILLVLSILCTCITFTATTSTISAAASAANRAKIANEAMNMYYWYQSNPVCYSTNSYLRARGFHGYSNTCSTFSGDCNKKGGYVDHLDCSSFVAMIYSYARGWDLIIPGSSKATHPKGSGSYEQPWRTVDFLNDGEGNQKYFYTCITNKNATPIPSWWLEPGDFVLGINNSAGNHILIYVGNGQVVHMTTGNKVRLDNVDNYTTAGKNGKYDTVYILRSLR